MLGAELGLPSFNPCTDMQLEIISELESGEHRVEPAPEDRREAEAWIRFLRLKKRQRALDRN
jgi:hypothetical protein